MLNQAKPQTEVVSILFNDMGTKAILPCASLAYRVLVNTFLSGLTHRTPLSLTMCPSGLGEKRKLEENARCVKNCSSSLLARLCYMLST